MQKAPTSHHMGVDGVQVTVTWT